MITGRNVWSTEGCTQKWIHESQVMCKCNHLTNFAVFMSLHQTPDNDPALNIISFVGCVLSIVCLVLTLAVYLVLWRYLKSEKSTLLVHLCISLALGYTIFLAGINRTDNKVMCTIIAALIHYCFLAVFVNFFCQGVALLVSVRSMTSRSFLKHYLVLIYVVPLVVVATTLAVTGATGHGTSNYCWLSTDGGVIWSFIGPALFVLTMNILVLIVVIQSIQSSYGMMDKSIRARSVSVARTLCFLTPIFGLSWVFGILSMSSEEKVFQYLFAFLNSLQGLFIFILPQCLVRKQVRDGFVKLKRQIRSRTLTSSSKTLSTDSNVKKSAEVTL
ncbi:Adhesion G protein-coupled receptor L3 [Bulinus truncatus]|nr:Adhesion G protein-coupled receptor L3 [Bulinus truncatus]